MSKTDTKNKQPLITYNYKGKDLTIRELVAHPDNVSAMPDSTIRARVKRGVPNAHFFDKHFLKKERVYQVLGSEYTLRELVQHELNVFKVSEYALKDRIAKGKDGKDLFQEAWNGYRNAPKQVTKTKRRVINQFPAHHVRLSRNSQLINSLGGASC